MRYLGGKHRQAKEIREVVAQVRYGRTHYLEPFIGGGSVFSATAPDFKRATASDASGSLVALWKAAVQGGWEPPVSMSRETWEAERDSTQDTALRAWAGYAASYNGKWFAGYGPAAAGRDYLAESARGFARKVAKLTGHPDLVFMHGDYAMHNPGRDTVVYCDPPYADTTGYKAADTFDHARFWATMNRWADHGAMILVHEYTAPSGWTAVHSRNRVETMHHGGPSSGKRVECIFIRER
jgi:DNA adenine methylase